MKAYGLSLYRKSAACNVYHLLFLARLCCWFVNGFFSICSSLPLQLMFPQDCFLSCAELCILYSSVKKAVCPFSFSLTYVCIFVSSYVCWKPWVYTNISKPVSQISFCVFLFLLVTSSRVVRNPAPVILNIFARVLLNLPFSLLGPDFPWAATLLGSLSGAHGLRDVFVSGNTRWCTWS